MVLRAENAFSNMLLGLVFILLLSSQVSAATDCPTKLTEALKEAIHENDLRVRNGGVSPVTGVKMFQGRRLYIGGNSYIAAVGAPFIQDLNALGAHDRWIDVGAGPEFKAMSDYFYDKQLGTEGKAQLVPINVTSTITNGHVAVEAAAKFVADSKAETHADGRTIEEYKKGEIKKAKLVTDVVAAISYSPHLPKVIEAEGDLLVEGGHLESVIFEEWANDSCVSIVDQNGRKVDLLAYLNSIKGLKLVRAQSEHINNGTHGNQFSFERTSGEIVAPPLELISYENASGTPGTRQVPQIVYRWVR